MKFFEYYFNVLKVLFLCVLVYVDFKVLLFFVFSHINTTKHIIADNIEPAGAANPIGNNVLAKCLEAKYENGIRTPIIEIELCINDIIDNP